MASPGYLCSASCGSSARCDAKICSTWPLVDGILSPTSQRDYPASPRRIRTKRRSVPDAVISPGTGVVRWRSAPTGKSQISPHSRNPISPHISPTMRVSPIAIGAGRAAVGFLRAGSHDRGKESSTPEGASSGCFSQYERVWTSGAIVDMPPASEVDMSYSVFGEKDIAAPTTPANGSERPCHARLRRRALTAFLNIKEETERCSCCNKAEYWVCFDIFCAMDRSQDGAVRRGDFVWALSAHGASLEFQRVVRRARLSAYFKSTAREISFEEFSQRIFPNASPTDIQKMQRWTCMRKAQKILTSETFMSQKEDMREVFTLLEEESGCGSVLLSDLVRAQIFTKAEILDIVPETQGPHISFEEFCDILCPSLARKYVSEGCRDSFLEDGSWYKEQLASKLEAIHQANVLDVALALSPKSSTIVHLCEDPQLLLYSAIASRSPKSQLCNTNQEQSSMSDVTTGPSTPSVVSAF